MNIFFYFSVKLYLQLVSEYYKKYWTPLVICLDKVDADGPSAKLSLKKSNILVIIKPKKLTIYLYFLVDFCYKSLKHVSKMSFYQGTLNNLKYAANKNLKERLKILKINLSKTLYTFCM